MDRKLFNQCMSPFMKGGKGKTKEERRMNMCIGAKLCTKKASNEAEALKLCNMPKLPKWAKDGAKSEEPEKAMTCTERTVRLKEAIPEIKSIIQSGQTDDIKKLLAQSLKDIHDCHAGDEDIVKLADDTFANIRTTTKDFFFKGEAREIYNDLDLLMKALEA